MMETAGFLEREVMRNFGVRTGVVFRHLATPKARFNSFRPLSAQNLPVSVQDPGPDGRVGTADDGGAFTAFNLDAAALARGILNQTTSLNDISSNYTTWEVTATKRMSSAGRCWRPSRHLGARLGLDRECGKRQLQPERHHQRRRRRPEEYNDRRGSCSARPVEAPHPHLAVLRAQAGRRGRAPSRSR